LTWNKQWSDEVRFPDHFKNRKLTFGEIEKNITSPLDDDALDLHPSLDLPPNESPTDTTEVTEQQMQMDTSSGKCPLLFDDEAYHEKPILEGRSKRNIKKRTIWDPSDIALHVEHVLNDIEVPIGNVTDETHLRSVLFQLNPRWTLLKVQIPPHFYLNQNL
jgi:hypothetical protein